jgi:hypothetical protein
MHRGVTNAHEHRGRPQLQHWALGKQAVTRTAPDPLRVQAQPLQHQIQAPRGCHPDLT